MVIQRKKPFCVRYLLHIHSETVNLDVAGRLADLFNASPGFTVSQAKRKHGSSRRRGRSYDLCRLFRRFT